MSRVMTLISRTLVLLVAIAFAAAAVLLVASDSDGRDRSSRDRTPADRQPRKESTRAPVDLSRLVAATTAASLPAAPVDATPQATTDGLVVRPLRVVPVFDDPAGRAFARMPAQQFGDTWLPVIAQRAGWVRVLLPSRPNGATGWLRESCRAPDVAVPHSRPPRFTHSRHRLRGWLDRHLAGRRGQARHPHADGPDIPPRLGHRRRSVLLTDHPAARLAQRHTRHLRRRAWHGRPPRLARCFRIRVRRQSRLHPGPSGRIGRLTQVPLGTLVIVDNG